MKKTLLLLAGMLVTGAAVAAVSSVERTKLQIAFSDSALADKVADSVDRSEGGLASIGFTVAAESPANYIQVSLQFKDQDGNDLAVRSSALCYTASDAAGDTPVASFEAFNGVKPSAHSTYDGSIMILGTNMRLVITESDGDADLVYQETSTDNYYLCCELPDGDVSCSGVIDFS